MPYYTFLYKGLPVVQVQPMQVRFFFQEPVVWGLV